MNTDIPSTIGLIAGNGQFPFMFAKAAKDQNIKVIVGAVKGDTSFLLNFLVDEMRWFAPGDLAKLLQYFKKANIKHVIMAGQVNPDNLFDKSVTMDDEFKKLFEAIKDRKTDTILAAVAERLADYGMELLDSTLLLKKYLAPQGTLTKRAPSEAELADITFGIELAKQMGDIDVGQTVVVKDKAVVAIEAMEGTDRAILRGGEIAQEGAVVVKQSKPKQDNRFDVPVIGPRTIKNMIKCRAKCLAIESGKTLIIDLENCVDLANRNGICIVSG